MKWWLVCSIFLVACSNYDAPHGVQEQKHSDRVYVDTGHRLFFLNVRQYFYDKEVNEKAEIHYYRYKERYQGDSQPSLNLAIADAWTRGEAYLILEPNSYFTQKDSITLDWFQESSGLRGKLHYKKGHPKEDYTFAKQVYHNLQRGVSLTYQGTAVFNQKQQEVFGKVFRDYNKLISHK